MTTKNTSMRRGTMGYVPEEWRTGAKYPSPDTKMRIWAGEFLLRNTDFQDALRRLRRLPGPKNDYRSPYRKRLREIGEQFGLFPSLILFLHGEPIIYPAFKNTPYSLRSGVRLAGATCDAFVGEDYGWGAALVFDLRKPIAPQLRTAGRILKGTKRSGVFPLSGAQRDRGAGYQLMLRILDARSVDASWKTIAECIFPGKNLDNGVDHARKLHKKAVALRDGG